MEKTEERLVFLTKHGPEHPEKATLPLAMATGAMATGIGAIVVLQSDAVTLARKGMAEHVFAPGITPFKELLDIFLEDGGTLLVCTACLEARQLTEDDLVEGCERASVARLAMEFSEATNVVSY